MVHEDITAVTECERNMIVTWTALHQAVLRKPVQSLSPSLSLSLLPSSIPSHGVSPGVNAFQNTRISSSPTHIPPLLPLSRMHGLAHTNTCAQTHMHAKSAQWWTTHCCSAMFAAARPHKQCQHRTYTSHQCREIQSKSISHLLTDSRENTSVMSIITMCWFGNKNERL